MRQAGAVRDANLEAVNERCRTKEAYGKALHTNASKDAIIFLLWLLSKQLLPLALERSHGKVLYVFVRGEESGMCAKRHT